MSEVMRMTEPAEPAHDTSNLQVGQPRRNLATERPTACPDVSAYPLDDELVLYEARRGQAYVLNRTAAQIWGLCDGSRTTLAVAQAIAGAYPVTYTEVLTDVCECLEHLRHAGLLTR
jgi:Coenzyme PQQ synthesis protein D (PqqD)